MTSGIPISRVTRDGQVERLGEWHHDSRTLVLEREGFPFLGPGRHVIEGELPWIFWEMCPSGYMARRLRKRPAWMHLDRDPRRWTREEAVQILCADGIDLSGNLLLGHSMREAFATYRPTTLDFVEGFREARADAGASDSRSYLGGERPKATFFDGRYFKLAKFCHA